MPFTLECSQCREVFQSVTRKGKTKRFCSRACYADSIRGPRPGLRKLADRKCEQCKELFHPTDNTKIFCSRPCSASYHYNPSQRGEKNTRWVECRWCGESFARNRKEQRFCGMGCFRSYQRRPRSKQRCRRCKEPYPATTEFFTADAQRSSGLHPYCKDCKYVQDLKYRKRNNYKLRIKSSEYRRANAGKVKVAMAKNRKLRKQAGKKISGDDVWRMLEDQDHLCAYCEVPLFGNFEIDHMVPISKGGSNDWSNIALTCRYCNRSKYNRTVEEFMERFHLKPEFLGGGDG